MSQKSGTVKEPAEKVVQHISRSTRKRYSAEESEPTTPLVRESRPTGSSWKACATRPASPSCDISQNLNRTVWGCPLRCKRLFQRLRTCGQVRSCVRPLDAAVDRRGPVWRFVDRVPIGFLCLPCQGQVVMQDDLFSQIMIS